MLYPRVPGVALASSQGPMGSSVGSGLSQRLWQEGQEYHFRYEGRQLNGIPQLNSQYSGMGIHADVKLQVARDQQQADVTVFTIRIQDPRYKDLLLNERKRDK